MSSKGHEHKFCQHWQIRRALDGVPHLLVSENSGGRLFSAPGRFSQMPAEEHRYQHRTVVQPRWGNDAVLRCVTQGTRHSREPWAMDCNAVGVGAIERTRRQKENAVSLNRCQTSASLVIAWSRRLSSRLGETRLREAEGTGLEPATPYGALHFQ